MDDKKQETLTEVDSQEDICENQKKKEKTMLILKLQP